VTELIRGRYEVLDIAGAGGQGARSIANTIVPSR